MRAFATLYRSVELRGMQRPRFYSYVRVAARLWIAAELSACGRVGVHLLPQREDASWPDASAARDSGAGLLDAGAVLDASLPDAGARDSGPSDAGSVPDASQPDAGRPRPASGVRVQVDNGLGPELTSYPVRVTLDTAAAIAAGLLRPDCTGLSVALSDRCAAPLPYFLPDSACNSTSTELWVRVPTITANGRVELDVIWAGLPGTRSEGAGVFPFFDDFDGNAVDSTRWRIIGDGSVSVSGGVLGAIGIFMLQSVATLVSAGDSALGVRLAVQGRTDTDVEIGVGRVTPGGSWNWAYERVWDGTTFVSFLATAAAYNGPTGSSCDNLLTGQPPPKLGVAWADVDPTPPSFLEAEFRYDIVGTQTSASLRTSRGGDWMLTTPQNCMLPARLPVLIGLDHASNADTQVQRVDYVYVRPRTTSEPLVTIEADAVRCPGT